MKCLKYLEYRDCHAPWIIFYFKFEEEENEENLREIIDIKYFIVK